MRIKRIPDTGFCVRFKNFLASDDRIGRIVYRNMLEILVGRLKRREGDIDLLAIVR